jgi:uncharacterized protein YuzE
MADMKHFNVTYDSASDVLYISTVKVAAARGVEDEHGILWRYAGNGELIGVTILDYRDLWYGRRRELAREMARKFHVPAGATERVLERVLA